MPNAYQHAPPRSAYTCTRGSPGLAAIARYTAVILIALLNPLACVVHCALTHEHAALAGEQRAFLCDLSLSRPALAAEMLTASWDGPRAVYQALMAVAPLICAVILVLARLRPHVGGIGAHITLPDSPPPKARPRLAIP